MTSPSPYPSPIGTHYFFKPSYIQHTPSKIHPLHMGTTSKLPPPNPHLDTTPITMYGIQAIAGPEKPPLIPCSLFASCGYFS